MREAMTREAEGVARTTELKKETSAEYVRRYVEQGPGAAAQWAASPYTALQRLGGAPLDRRASISWRGHERL